MIKCPSCGLMMQPIQRYLSPKAHWYTIERAAVFCPKCDSRIMLLWTPLFKVLYWTSVVLVTTGIAILIASFNRPGDELEVKIGEATLGAGSMAFIGWATNRRFAVAANRQVSK